MDRALAERTTRRGVGCSTCGVDGRHRRHDVHARSTPMFARWAQDNGFAMYDYDSFCATPGVELPGDLHCLDPGLA